MDTKLDELSAREEIPPCKLMYSTSLGVTEQLGEVRRKQCQLLKFQVHAYLGTGCQTFAAIGTVPPVAFIVALQPGMRIGIRCIETHRIYWYLARW